MSDDEPRSSGDEPGGRSSFLSSRIAAPFAVHMFTASGAALGLLALLAATRNDWAWMFLWLGLALIVDGVDGVMARRLNVAEILPRWSGDTLDLVVDFTTYVFVPAYAIAASRLLPAYVDILAGMAIAVSGALYFADRAMKMPGHYFRGFPALWNLVAFYLLLVQPNAWVGAVLIAGLVVMTFLPFPFVHPVRVRRFRALSIALIVLWAALALLTLMQDMRPGALVTGILCAIALYFLVIGLFRGGETA